MTKRASFQGDIIPGMLLLIDIEKAFDSISWMFIESVLDFFNFVSPLNNGLSFSIPILRPQLHLLLFFWETPLVIVQINQ